MTKTKTSYTIKLKSYDVYLLDNVAQTIIDEAKSLGIVTSGSIPLPTKREVITVLRDPFVHKPAMEQFERRTHVRIITVQDKDNSFISKLKSINVPSAVEVKIK